MLTLVKNDKVQEALAWFRDLRRTRPFWGGLWMFLGGFLILRVSAVSLGAAVSGGITSFGGWLTGGGLIVCAVLVWADPGHRIVSGIIGLLLAISSLVVSNLGGFFIGMLLGIIGGSMVIAWGPKRVAETTEETSE
ncbi:DUF6114 domain-containing protein [Smaragdicoccus niigatensis]|uniref:DUF6114 domain-containing protein n=1 Tax=Smaragdicoccus niigatensis TaxID=359359 RepID=UPI0003736BB8|nr:DUF6114 domain-containing protein [Smaragdicoccus niigatensis]